MKIGAFILQKIITNDFLKEFQKEFKEKFNFPSTPATDELYIILQ